MLRVIVRTYTPATFTCSKATIETLEKELNTFNIYNKDVLFTIFTVVLSVDVWTYFIIYF